MDKVERYVSVLSDESDETRRNAAEALAKFRDPRAVEALIRALGDKHGGVRYAAIIALGKIGDPRAVESLGRALGNENYPWFERVSDVTALFKIGDLRGVDPLIHALGDQSGDVRSSAIHALGELGDTRAVDPLMRALSDQDSELRQAAIEDLRKLGGPTSASPLSPQSESLIQATRDEGGNIRGEARDTINEMVNFNPINRGRYIPQEIKGKMIAVDKDGSKNSTELTEQETINTLEANLAAMKVVDYEKSGQWSLAIEQHRKAIALTSKNNPSNFLSEYIEKTEGHIRVLFAFN